MIINVFGRVQYFTYVRQIHMLKYLMTPLQYFDTSSSFQHAAAASSFQYFLFITSITSIF